MDDKRQITGTYCVSLSGEFLPIQLIYQGKTDQCHPKRVKFPKGFHVTHTINHWSNEVVHLEYLRKEIIPCVEPTRKKLNLPADQKSLIFYDVFKGQTTGQVTTLLEKHHIISKKYQRTKLISSSLST